MEFDLHLKLTLARHHLLKINKDGITVSLKKGVEYSLTYCNPQTNEKFKVYYNSRRSSKTVSQKPDNILAMHKEEFRLFLELKRLYNEISIKPDTNIYIQSEIRAFCIDNINIVVNKESIMSILGENVICVSMDDFIKSPMKSIKKLLKK